jgi:hypothetical protein
VDFVQEGENAIGEAFEDIVGNWFDKSGISVRAFAVYEQLLDVALEVAGVC